MRRVLLTCLSLLLLAPLVHAAPVQNFAYDIPCTEGSAQVRVTLCRFSGFLQFSALNCDASMCHVGVTADARVENSVLPHIFGSFRAASGFFAHDETMCDTEVAPQTVSCRRSITVPIAPPSSSSGCTFLDLDVGGTFADPASSGLMGDANAHLESRVCLVGGVPTFTGTSGSARYFPRIPT